VTRDRERHDGDEHQFDDECEYEKIVDGNDDEFRDIGGRSSTSSSELFPDFTPTRDELNQLTRHHLKLLYEIDVSYGLYGIASGSDNRDYLSAKERLALIERAIGADAVQEINREVGEEYRRRIGDRAWRIMKSGSPEERAQLRNELHAESSNAGSVDEYEYEELETASDVSEYGSSACLYNDNEQQAKPLAEQSLDDFDEFFRRCSGITYIFLASGEVNTVHPNIVDAIRLADCCLRGCPFTPVFGEGVVPQTRDSLNRSEIVSQIRDRVAEMNRREVEYCLIWSISGDSNVHADGSKEMLHGGEVGWLLADEVKELFQCW